MKKLYPVILAAAWCLLMTNGYAVTHTIDCNQSGFTPSTVTVNLGDTVIFNYTGFSASNSHPRSNLQTTPNSFDCGQINVAVPTCTYVPQQAPDTVDFYDQTQPANTGQIIVLPAVGTQGINAIAPSFVYPNPFNAKTTVTLPGADAEKIEVLNMMGQTVETVFLKGTEKTVELDLTDIPEGVYFYRIFREGQVTETKRIIKN